MIVLALLLADAPLTAEAAMARARALTSVAPPPCAPGRAGEIVVCARRNEVERLRLPLPDERDVADAPRLPSGGRPAASAAPVRGSSCGVVAQGQVCTGGVNMAAVGAALARGITAIVDPDTILEPDDFRRTAPAPSRPHHESGVHPD